MSIKQSRNKPCPECNGTGKLVYSNTGIENDCMYCNGFGVIKMTNNPRLQHLTSQEGKEK